jgi:glycosyltransferase involved in cell wall biosynthesis
LDVADRLSDAVVLLDCRWLGAGGVGRATELLLKEFCEEPPPGTWLLWGKHRDLDPATFATARIVECARKPGSFFGQRALPGLPQADAYIFMHQIRPLRGRPSITFIHDTIPIRFGGNRVARRMKHAYLVLVSRFTDRVITVSEASRDRIVRDLRLPLDSITVVRMPVDMKRAKHIAVLRGRVPQRQRVLTIGRFAVHKNLHRMIEAFQETAYCGEGGRLMVVGGDEREVVRLSRHVEKTRARNIVVRPACTEHELDHLLASSRAVVAAGAEEGFGLPAFEAVACGLPLAASPAGAVSELPPERVRLMDPNSTESIARAIDEATQLTIEEPIVLRPPLYGAAIVDEVRMLLRT